METLPQDVQVEYYAEGAANVIYEILLPPAYAHQRASTPPIEADLDLAPESQSSTTPPPTSISPPRSPDEFAALRNRLLRLRKAKASSLQYAEQTANQQRLIFSHFTEDVLVKQSLVKLPTGFLEECNVQLKKLEEAGKRASKRNGVYLDTTEQHGVLVEDMRSTMLGHYTYELKPKWLLQSPNAPSDAKRCRTCALRAMRTANAQDSTVDFCPLTLVTGDVDLVCQCVVQNPSRDQPRSKNDTERTLALLSSFLHKSTVFSQLRDLQHRFDPNGILAIPRVEDVPVDFLIAMALRDCVLFIKVDLNTGSVDGKLADLDIKAATAKKFDHWQGTERALIDDGWYSGDNDNISTGCLLSRQQESERRT